MSRSHLEALQLRFRQGERLKFLCFWGHTASRPDRIGQECLSQWYPAAFTVDDVPFATTEHFMMYRKAKLFCDEHAAADILTAPSPGAAKALGRSVRGFDQAVWEAERFGIVVADPHIENPLEWRGLNLLGFALIEARAQLG